MDKEIFKIGRKNLIELIEEVKPKKLTNIEIDFCHDVVKNIRLVQTHKGVCHMKTLLAEPYITSTAIAIRKLIQLIRMHSDKFLKKDEFLIAFKKGYMITSDVMLINRFYEKTVARYRNTTPQLLQLIRIIQLNFDKLDEYMKSLNEPKKKENDI